MFGSFPVNEFQFYFVVVRQHTVSDSSASRFAETSFTAQNIIWFSRAIREKGQNEGYSSTVEDLPGMLFPRAGAELCGGWAF